MCAAERPPHAAHDLPICPPPRHCHSLAPQHHFPARAGASLESWWVPGSSPSAWHAPWWLCWWGPGKTFRGGWHLPISAPPLLVTGRILRPLGTISQECSSLFRSSSERELAKKAPDFLKQPAESTDTFLPVGRSLSSVCTSGMGISCWRTVLLQTPQD